MKRRPDQAANGCVKRFEVGEVGKNGSQPVSRVLSRLIIHLGDASPHHSSDLPGSHLRTTGCENTSFPIWSCSRWGLPCRGCCQQRGALLPHHFTLAGSDVLLRRYLFCCTFRRITPPRRYLAPCPAEPGLSSISRLTAINRLTPMAKIDLPGGKIKRIRWRQERDSSLRDGYG